MQDIKSITESLQRTAAQYKVPPHSIEAEQSILGGLMLDNAAWDRVADLVCEEDFYRRDHQLIFKALNALVGEGQPMDVVTVSEWLGKQNDLEQAGGLSYLGMLANNVPSVSNIKAYAGIVRERAVLRQLIQVSSKIGDRAFNPEGSGCAEILDEAEQAIFQIAERGSRSQRSFVAVKDLLSSVVDRIDKLCQTGGAVTGVATGYKDFDTKTSGLQPADLIIIAGRPSMGKTSFAMNVAEDAAINSNVPVAIFSMEMPADALVMRMLSSLGRIDQQKIRTGTLADDDWPRLVSTMSILNNAPLFIDDTPALNPTELRARARRLKREHNLGMIVIDYLQLMQVPGSKENRATEISEISRSLKALAKELEVPVLALSQLNRGLESRPDKRPVMSDLRESGAIEQDADLIVFIYRDEVYNQDSPEKGMAEIIIGKQRNGPIGMVPLTFHGSYTRFDNYTADHYVPEAYG